MRAREISRNLGWNSSTSLKAELFFGGVSSSESQRRTDDRFDDRFDPMVSSAVREVRDPQTLRATACTCVGHASKQQQQTPSAHSPCLSVSASRSLVFWSSGLLATTRREGLGAHIDGRGGGGQVASRMNEVSLTQQQQQQMHMSRDPRDYGHRPGPEDLDRASTPPPRS
eukprot:545699-Rhodomonas_salina.1